MTIAATTIFECNHSATVGNVNGGGFNPSNANGLTDGVISSGTGNSPTFSSVSYAFTAADVTANAWIYFPTQANITAGWYQIASQSGGVATLKAAIGQAVQFNAINPTLFAANTVAGVGSASPTGVTFLVDYSQGTAAIKTFTNLGSANGSTTITDNSSGGFFTKVMVGNLIGITTGTNATLGWYEIVSWTDANNVVLDRTPHGANTMSSTTGNVGGAFSLGSSTTNLTDLLAMALGTNSATAAPHYFIKGNATYTLGTGGGTTPAGNAVWPSIMEGYNTRRGDRPTGSTRPIFDNSSAAVNFATAANSRFVSIQTTTNETHTPLVLGLSSSALFCKITNTGTGVGVNLANGSCALIACEIMSLRSTGINSSASNNIIAYNYIHDCGTSGITSGGSTTPVAIIGNIVANCVTQAINCGSANTSYIYSIIGNTLYGAENKLGNGITITSGSAREVSIMNNLIYGFVNGIQGGEVQTSMIDFYNCLYNNTNNIADITKYPQGGFDISINPSFTNAVQRTGATATTTAGNHLVQVGATFQTWGVVTGDIVQIVSGTGPTLGLYQIASVDSETQITTTQTLTANATGDKVWQITQGHNFSVGAALKATGYPGTFPGGLTTGYIDIGAVQRQEPTISYTF